MNHQQLVYNVTAEFPYAKVVAFEGFDPPVENVRTSRMTASYAADSPTALRVHRSADVVVTKTDVGCIVTKNRHGAAGQAIPCERVPSLSLRALRMANRVRLPEFKSATGEPAHSEPDGSDWTLSDWMTALTGEVGEAANYIKKWRRGDLTREELRPLVAKELADILAYTDLLASQLDIDLGETMIAKFNEVSQRIECDLRLDHDGVYRIAPKRWVELAR